MEKQTHHKIKILRTDQGGEYLSNEFSTFCQEQGIKRETTIAYTPQQNGVFERKNRTVVGEILSICMQNFLIYFGGKHFIQLPTSKIEVLHSYQIHTFKYYFI